MLSFNFDASKGETPASIAQKRALIAQLMGSARSPSNLGEGFSALGDGIVANVEGGRARDAESKGQASANSTFGALTGMLTGQGGATPSAGPAFGSDFMSGLINSESGGNWGALNSEGYGGRLQFGDARLADAAAAGVIPAGVTGADFSRMAPEQQQAVEAWHFSDIDQQAQDMGLDRYYGQTIAGVPITSESVKAMAHLGGIGGVQKFIASGGQYNPADSNGTRLSDYGSRFGGSGQQAAPAPVQVASLDPSIGGAPQAQPAQLPPIAPPQPQPVAQAAPMQTAGGPSLQMLMEAAANPWLNDSQKGIINSMIAQQMQQMDPAYQMEMQLKQAELAAATAPKVPDVPDGFQTLDMRARAAGFQPGTAEYQQFMANGGEQATGGLDFGDTSGVRKEIQALPSYKNYAQALPIYRSMVETAGRNSRASDLNLVYGLGKIMDPGSVVREGEMVMVQNTSSLPSWLTGQINALNGGASLDEATRRSILEEAYGRVRGYDQAFQQDTAMYQGIAERNMINPADIIPDFGTYEQWEPAEPTPTAPVAQVSAPQSQPPVVNQQDYQLLPSGSPFVADGDPTMTVRIKP